MRRLRKNLKTMERVQRISDARLDMACAALAKSTEDLRASEAQTRLTRRDLEVQDALGRRLVSDGLTVFSDDIFARKQYLAVCAIRHQAALTQLDERQLLHESARLAALDAMAERDVIDAGRTRRATLLAQHQQRGDAKEVEDLFQALHAMHRSGHAD